MTWWAPSRARRPWKIMIAISSMIAFGVGCILYLIGTGIGVGSEQDRRLGLGHHQLRVVGRHRPRCTAISAVAALPSKVADGQPALQRP